jgi:hypothetical protein
MRCYEFAAGCLPAPALAPSFGPKTGKYAVFSAVRNLREMNTLPGGVPNPAVFNKKTVIYLDNE